MELKEIFVACGIIFNTNKTKILISQRKASCKFAPNEWEFPGGKIEFGESPEECLKREIKEELDLHITVNKVFGNYSHIYEIEESKISVFLLTYFATAKSEEFKLIECQDAKWINISNIKDYSFAKADIQIVEDLIKSNI